MLGRTRSGSANDVFSHWFHLIEGMEASAQEFYGAVAEQVKARELPKVKIEKVNFHEAGPLSPKRVYLRVRRKDLMFDICGAVYGNGFFVSWWLGEKPRGFLGDVVWLLSWIPVVNLFVAAVRRDTYYKIDTKLMFQESIHNAVTEVLDGLADTQSLHRLTETQRAPKMKL